MVSKISRSIHATQQELDAMRLLSLDLKTKGWLISSIFVLLINLVVFIFRKYNCLIHFRYEEHTGDNTFRKNPG